MLQVDLYFAASDVIQLVKFHNPRNELEALHSVMLLIDNTILSAKNLPVDVLQALRDMTLDKISALGNRIREDTVILENVSCDRETCLLQWSEGEGVKTKLDIACKFFYCEQILQIYNVLRWEKLLIVLIFNDLLP